MKIVVSAGGTGGHIYPAIAIINKFKECEKNLEIIYIGTHDRMEKDIIPNLNIKYIPLEIYGFNKTRILRNFKNLYLIIKAKARCKKIMQKFKPDIVLGIGGYVTYPVIKAAHELGIKTFLHEQNSIPGKTNIFLSKKVDLIATSFKDSNKYFSNPNKVFYTGNPQGENALTIKAYDKIKLGFSRDKKLVIIVAGSLGSMTINAKMQDFLNKAENANYEILYITGKNYYEEFIKNKNFPKNIKVMPYFDDLPSIMKSADLIVTRAGATTIAEILSLRLAAIFIPSPYVANNHQYYNALEIKNNNAGDLILEKDLTSELLRNKIDCILNDNVKYEIMKNNLKKMAVTDSSKKIYDLIKECVK